MSKDTEVRSEGWTNSTTCRALVATAALTLLAVAGCGGSGEAITTGNGDRAQDAVVEPSGSAQACQDAVAALPAVAAFDRMPPTDVSAAARGSAGWIRGRVVDVNAGRTEPHDATYMIDGAQRSSGLVIVYADLAVEVGDADGGGADAGSTVDVEIPVAYLPPDVVERATEHVESLGVVCVDLVLTAFVRPADKVEDGSDERVRLGMTQLAGGLVEGVDGVRSLDPLVPGDEPLGVGSSAEFTAASGAE